MWDHLFEYGNLLPVVSQLKAPLCCFRPLTDIFLGMSWKAAVKAALEALYVPMTVLSKLKIGVDKGGEGQIYAGA